MPAPVRFPPAFIPTSAETMQIRLSRPPPGMSVGQALEIRVLERMADGRFLIDAGAARLTAETEHALQPGQTLAMRVESLRPRVVLTVLPASGERLVAEHLRGFRSNPAALTRSLADLAGIPGGRGAGGPSPVEGRDPLAAVLDALRTALPARERIAKGLSLPDFARALGLLTESDLKRATEKNGENLLRPSANLKTRLLKILQESASEDGKTIRPWSPPLEKAVRAIETLQVLNVHLQENEGKLFLQVPLLFAGLAGKADILIRRERHGAGTDARNGAFRVLLALDMDALGDVMAQVQFSGDTVTCSVHCENDESAAFVSGLLPSLDAGLTRAGYRVASLGAHADRRVRETMEGRLREEICGDGPALSVFA
jgi:transcriptional regulator with XRE-family HTH domain